MSFKESDRTSTTPLPSNLKIQEVCHEKFRLLLNLELVRNICKAGLRMRPELASLSRSVSQRRAGPGAVLRSQP